jgi:hypothetical protein
MPNPYATEWGLQVEKEVLPNLVLTLGYFGLHAQKIPVSISSDLRDPIAFLPSGKPNYQGRKLDTNYASVFVFRPFGHAQYNAGTLTVVKRFSNNLSFTANYVWSKGIDDTTSMGATGGGPEDPRNLRGNRAISSESVPHRLVLYFTGEAPKDSFLRNFKLGVTLTAQSGRFFSVTAGTDVNGDGNALTDRPDALGRNTYQSPAFATVDARLSRIFKLNERVKFEALVEGFNLLNKVNITDVNTVWGAPTLALPPSSTFGTPSAVANARQFRFGLKCIF